MKVLVDACVWSLALRRRSAAILSREEELLQKALKEAIEEGRVALIGPIRQEVLSGIRDPAHFEKLKATLQAFPDEPLLTPHYEEAARLFNLCRSRGFECGATDILLCAIAFQMKWEILTCDQGLSHCMEILRAEEINP